MKSYSRLDIRKAHVKVILSSPLDPMPDPLMAVLVLEGYSVVISGFKQHEAISISINAESTKGPERIHDIAFLHGKLYILSFYEGLHVFKHDANDLSEQKFFHQCIADDPKQQEIYSNYHLRHKQIYFEGIETGSEYIVLRYLAESNGRLLMVRRWMRFPENTRLGDHDKTFRFDVFEADLTTIPGQWTKVENLRGEALFLGSECSKSILASECEGGVQEDCIYFMHRVFDNSSRE